MEQAVSNFSVFPETKEAQESFVEMCVNEITSGERNPLDFEIILKNVEDIITKIRKDDRVKSCILNEANKYTEKVFRYGNYEFSKVIKPNFNFTNDQTWNDLKQKITDREALLKSIKPGVAEIADTETGNILAPPIITYSEYLTKKIKK